jgi:sugar phosphate permease
MINEKTIASSRWYRLIPVVFITYSLAYLDRANFGFGAAGGMAKDLHISPALSSLMGSLFFLGYFFFQIPGTIYASRKSARKLIFWLLICWGLCAMATGLISNVYLLLVIRFMLGAFESAVLPAAFLLLSRWFTRGERSRANTLLSAGKFSYKITNIPLGTQNVTVVAKISDKEPTTAIIEIKRIEENGGYILEAQLLNQTNVEILG